MVITAPDITDARDPHLGEAIEDAHYLLAYFTRTRVKIPPEKQNEFDESVRILSSAHAIGSRLFRPPADLSPESAGETLDARAAAGSDAIRAEQDAIAAFWKAFIHLSDLAYPATIESIRYYFRYYNFHSPATRLQTSSSKDKTKLGRAIKFYWNQLSFMLMTVIALFMTVGLSLLSYIGTKALTAHDQDYSHWSLVQALVEYLDEGAKAQLDGATLAITLNTADFPAPRRRYQPQKALSLSDPPTRSDHASNITFPVSKEEVERIKAILAAVDPTAPPVDFRFACKPLVTMLAIAQGKSPPPDDQPIVPGGVSVDDCINNLFNAVPPRFIAVANDLASTYSSALNEQETLNCVNEIILTPIRLFDVMVVRPFKWTYNGVRHILSGTAGPDKPDPPDKPESALSPANAFILFVLQQRHHIPLPRVLPIASATAVGTVFDGRLAVAITNTYLLTLSFGFLGACVWALREINLRLENFTLAPSQFPRYRARILLGMVAGPTIGLFFNEGHLLSFTTTSTDIPNLSTQLSASAIAFIAGFSIEILFAILDRFIRIVQEFAGADNGGGNLRHSR